MTPYHADDWLTVYQGDCREVMAAMEPASVHCVVTSPPYWGLRDYGTATWVGGDAECDHAGVKRMSDKTSIGRSRGKDVRLLPHAPSANVQMPYRETCGKCGAIRQDNQLGLEPTPEAYVENMVAVFREVRRVLRDDGTLWLNLGDTFHSGRGESGTHDPKLGARRFGKRPQDGLVAGLKPKDLVGIPWRVALALQSDGWWLRCDVVWDKPNTLPEPSAHDRPDRNHEYLFLLTKSRRYHFDKDAVREASDPRQEEHNRRYAKVYDAHTDRADERQPGNVNNVGIHSRPGKGGRPIRSVWKIATTPYPEHHAATFPPKLVEPCVKAGCPSGGVVLDPFAGSGTTGMVAQALGRRAVLIDLNGDYLIQAMRRNQQSPLGLDVA